MSNTDKVAGKSWASTICQAAKDILTTNAGKDEVVEYLNRDSSAKTADFKAGVQEYIDSINGAKT